MAADLKTRDLAMIGVSASLYAIVGYLTNLGIVSPVVGVVRFWPSVIVPAVFAALFGPWVGGISASIGIFISDMIHPGHGIALLSLTVGVPSNFAAFFLIGLISRRNVKWLAIASALIFGGAGLTGLVGYLLLIEVLTVDVAALFLAVFFACCAIVIVAGLWKPEWRSYGVASVVVTRIAEEDWTTYRAAFPVRVGFRDRNGKVIRHFAPGDRGELVVSLPKAGCAIGSPP